MKTFDYAGKTWRYDEKTIFQLEIGRYHNSYHHRQSFPHDMLENAIEEYEQMNVSDGYKKRLSMIANNTKIHIIHHTSKREKS